MPLVPMSEIAARATEAGSGVGAFNAIQLEHAEAIVRGAEEADRPVVLQLSENAARYHGGLAPLALASLALAERSTADVVVHLDHATSEDLVREALDLGLRSVMFDAATLSHGANVTSTRAVVEHAHGVGAWVEAELGEVGGKDGAHVPGVRTDPGEAAEFVGATGVDALAVAVGSSHAMADRSARLDNDLIAALAEAVAVPLVLHGSSGVPDDGLVAAVAHGMRKINIGTHLNRTLTASVRQILAEDEALTDPRKYLGPARDEVAAEVTRLLLLLNPTDGGRR